MNLKSRSPISAGHGGKRAGAGRKPTGTISLHLRVPPETLSQIVDLIDGRRGRTRGAVVTEALAEKYARWRKAKGKARREAHERFEHLDDPKIKEWRDEVRAELAPHESLHCKQSTILAKHAANVVMAQPADMQDRLDWLVVEAERNWFNIAFTIKHDGVAYRWSPMTYNQMRSAGIFRDPKESRNQCSRIDSERLL